MAGHDESEMIHPTAVIGDPPEHRDYAGERTYKPVISPNAKINAFVTVDAGLVGPTLISTGCFIMKHCHIGHDARLGVDCELAPGTTIGGHAILGKGVRCGMGVIVKPWVKIGDGARLGMGAIVISDVPAGEVWAGNPAKRLQKHPASEPQMTRPEEDGWWEWWERSRRVALEAET